MNGIRWAQPADEKELQRLWETVFGPEKEFIDLFFKTLFVPENTAVISCGGQVVSAAYRIDFGPYRYIYAVGTDPAYRGRGFGKAVTMLAADGKPAYLYPANEELRRWYMEAMGAVCVCPRPIFDEPGELTPISSEEYVWRREALLSGRPHAVYPRGVTSLFVLDGAFYADAAEGIRAVDGSGRVCEALPCRFGGEPYILGLNGAAPVYWGLTLE